MSGAAGAPSGTGAALRVRRATATDAKIILGFVRELAAYEREPEAVKATHEVLAAQLASERPPFECLIAELDGEPAGFALFFHNYSTWRGRPGLYLEDLFVPDRFRRRGIGLGLLVELARIARERQCARMEWAVLDWNRPAIDFYESLGARPMTEWTTFRMDEAAIAALAER